MFFKFKTMRRDFFNCCNDSHYNNSFIGHIGNIVEYFYHIACTICTNTIQFDSVCILIWYDWYLIQNIFVTRFDGIIATHCANLMIVVSFERRRSELSIHGLTVNFAASDAKLQSNQKGIHGLILFESDVT